MARQFVACNRWCITEVSLPIRFYGARQALDEIFVKTTCHDVYSNVSSERCSFSDLLHRKAVDGMP